MFTFNTYELASFVVYLVLVTAAGLAIHWAVRRAFKPLVDLADAVERRSPAI